MAEPRAAALATRVVLAGLFVAALACVGRNWGLVWSIRELLPRTSVGFLELVHPGFHGTVQWVRERGLGSLRSLPYDSDKYRYQRLTEMLYPIELQPTAVDALKSGDLVAVGVDVEMAMPVDELWRAGELRVVAVR